MTESWPDDEVLLLLGRVGYAAIMLEPVVDWICRVIEFPTGQVDKRPISTRIGSACSVAESAGDLEGREAIRAWLLRADAAMERRNSIFHGEPVDMFDEEAMAWGESALLHRSRRPGEQVSKTPLTVPGLQVALDELVAAYAEWLDIFRLVSPWRLERNRQASQNRDEVAMLREQKVTALREAREAYRQSMLEPERPELGSLFAGRRGKLQTAVKAAEAELRLFDVEHPRT
jgi:hypothetical protein